MGFRLGIDTGGTFTDLVALDEQTHELTTCKSPSTPRLPVQSLAQVLTDSGVNLAEVGHIQIGTTVVINAILARTGANVLFITTQGMRDILFIQRINRKYHYNLNWRKPQPLVKRRNVVEVAERLDSRGEPLVALDGAALEELKRSIQAILTRQRIDAFAVCLLFSYLNPAHEQAIGQYLARHYPEIPVSLSHRVSPVWREYERSCTVVANAYVAPIVEQYVQGVEAAMAKLKLRCPTDLIKSNGGTQLLRVAPERPLNLLLSGLAGGIIAGRFFGAMTGREEVITLDMGGTSSDTGLIHNGRFGYTTEFEIEWGHPVSTPVIDLSSIGAGGGSIGWKDKGGFLRVGPQSAGADPGPACYDKGGLDPTLTDAHLVVGRLNPEYFLAGRMALSPTKARDAIGRLSGTLQMPVEETALSMIRISSENMAGQIKLITVDRGLDPRDFALVAFGGAGPLHATEIARSLGMSDVVIPVGPGMCSALGAMIADMQVDKVTSCAARSDTLDSEDLRGTINRVRKEALDGLAEDGYSGEALVLMFVSMRYLDQNYEQDIAVSDDFLQGADITSIVDRFHERHRQFYGYCFPESVVEMIHVKVSAVGKIPFRGLKELGTTAHPPPIGDRTAVLSAGEALRTPVYRRQSFGAGTRLTGPAIIEEPASTTFLGPGDELETDRYGNFIIRVEGTSHES